MTQYELMAHKKIINKEFIYKVIKRMWYLMFKHEYESILKLHGCLPYINAVHQGFQVLYSKRKCT